MGIALTTVACRSKKVAQCNVAVDAVEVAESEVRLDVRQWINDSCEVEIDSPRVEMVRPDSIVVVMKARKITARKKVQTKTLATAQEQTKDSTTQATHVVARSVSERKPLGWRWCWYVAGLIGLIIAVLIIKKVRRNGKYF